MMDNIEIRCAIEWREDHTREGPGHLSGSLLTYETRAVDRPEEFADGSLEWRADGVVLNIQHNRKRPIVRFIPRVENREVLIDVKLPDTTDGRDAATLVRDGTAQGLSGEFVVMREEYRNGVRRVLRAKLIRAGLVDDSSYRTRVEVRHRRLPRLWL